MRTSGLVLTFLTLFVSQSTLDAAPATQPTPATQSVVHEPARASDFMRFVDQGSTGSRLETADVAYRNRDGLTVHLVATVHIGQRAYFEGLNQNFKLRDAVLYEMVKPTDAPLPGPGGVQSSTTISQL